MVTSGRRRARVRGGCAKASPTRPTAASDAPEWPTGMAVPEPSASSHRETAGPGERLSPELTARRVGQTLPIRALGSAGRLRVHCGTSQTGRVRSATRLAVSDRAVEVSEHTVLARVYPSADVAGRSLASDDGGRRRTPTRPLRGARGEVCRRRRI